MTRSRLAIRSDLMLAKNIRALLHARQIDDSALAAWCGHRPAWLSKILNGERGLRIKELGKIADFFGVEVAQLFQYGIDPLLERRRHQRRINVDRRTGLDRRASQGGSSHVASSSPSDPAVVVAARLTALSEQLEAVAAAYLTRVDESTGPATLAGVGTPSGTESHPPLRGARRQASTKKAG